MEKMIPNIGLEEVELRKTTQSSISIMEVYGDIWSTIESDLLLSILFGVNSKWPYQARINAFGEEGYCW